MAIYRISALPKIYKSSDRRDSMVAHYLFSRGMPSVSHREYKYLYIAATVSTLARRADSEFSFQIAMDHCLAFAKIDSDLEAGKAKLALPGVPTHILQDYNRIERLTLEATTFRSHILAREEQAICLSEMISEISHLPSRAPFWDSVCGGSYVLDTLVDYWKDRKDGLVKKAKFSDFAYLAKRFAKHTFDVLRQLGAGALFELVPVVLLCAKGGFDNEKKKNEQKKIEFPQILQVQLD